MIDDAGVPGGGGGFKELSSGVGVCAGAGLAHCQFFSCFFFFPALTKL